MESNKVKKQQRGGRPLVPGTQEHETAVKGVLSANLDKTLEMLEQLDVLEAKHLEIGNAFLAFRFNVNPDNVVEPIEETGR